MRIPVNYGEVNVAGNRIRVGVGLISRLVGGLMVTIVLLLLLFIISIGGAQYLVSTSSAQLWVLGALILYFGLRFMGAWSDVQIMDSQKQEIRTYKHWLFVPYSKKVFSFKTVRAVSWQEIINKKVGARQMDTRSTQVIFNMEKSSWLTIASISLANPDETLKAAERLAHTVADFVHCPVRGAVEKKVVVG